MEEANNLPNADDGIDVATKILDCTLEEYTNKLKERNPASIKVYTLLSRKNSRKYNFTPDFVGKEVGNEYLVGYGMDYNDLFRNLPYIASLDDRFYKQ